MTTSKSRDNHNYVQPHQSNYFCITGCKKRCWQTLQQHKYMRKLTFLSLLDGLNTNHATCWSCPSKWWHIRPVPPPPPSHDSATPRHVSTNKWSLSSLPRCCGMDMPNSAFTHYNWQLAEWCFFLMSFSKLSLFVSLVQVFPILHWTQ